MCEEERERRQVKVEGSGEVEEAADEGEPRTGGAMGSREGAQRLLARGSWGCGEELLLGWRLRARR